ncbi:hypothetical protein D3C76_1770210 [compost metagenome]
MQAADHATADFHGHLITPVHAADAQTPVVTAQPQVLGFVIDVEQLHRRVMLAVQLMQVISQRVNAAAFNDKL